jgi:hypothetical protein
MRFMVFVHQDHEKGEEPGVTFGLHSQLWLGERMLAEWKGKEYDRA